MENLNILLGQSFTHMAGSEEAANKIVRDYKDQYTDLKKTSVTRKIKKGVEYWTVSITVDHYTEKDTFDNYFGE